MFLRATARASGLSHHILPTAGTMIGVCTTLIGLVKIYETETGPSRVDEAAALAAVLFLASAIGSYLSIRVAADSDLALRLERAADACFVLGLIGLSMIALLFAYEAI
ncbi:hypothetical protein Q8W71_07860 [Methylobacterium sp. NEAU 140]|uniref:hypothetical protein n=1 Tax=Methylobacterium sp. NEAU 140 TaxID=3064945 RepID=UPI002733D2A6|nr:hypothetical protein [Methylobacterium sp. NEAU 140]MDP4022534.1 hypothetical protein [Methylobacterium sp. NEAU 140]